MPIIKSLIGSADAIVCGGLLQKELFFGVTVSKRSRARSLSRWVLCLTSMAFGFVHVSNPNAVPLVTFSIPSSLALWLALAHLRTRSLWLPLGVHWSWNWALGWFFGVRVSGFSVVSHRFSKQLIQVRRG